jgi:hypothetical protein
MSGFSFRYRLSGGAPTIQSLLYNVEAQLTTGDILAESGGGAILGVTGGSKFLGVALNTKKGKTTDSIEVITDADAVYAVDDANARALGDTLDIAGATGAQKVATSSNKEFVVVAPSTASQETLVRINVGKHLNNTAQ